MSSESKIDSYPKYVRVTGCRAKDLIEFDFAVGTPELFVELILPEAAFAEFCRNNDVTILPSGIDGHPDNPLDWRLRDANLAAGKR